jgi:hypothetical protein
VLKDSRGRDAESMADQEAYAIARWLQSNMRRLRRGEVCVKFRDLRQILSSYECRFETVPGNRLNIFRGSARIQVYHNGNDNRDVEPNTIHKTRKDLSLDESHGYDSDIFYNALPRIDDFMVKYRRVLDRLAKV